MEGTQWINSFRVAHQTDNSRCLTNIADVDASAAVQTRQRGAELAQDAHQPIVHPTKRAHISDGQAVQLPQEALERIRHVLLVELDSRAVEVAKPRQSRQLAETVPGQLRCVQRESDSVVRHLESAKLTLVHPRRSSEVSDLQLQTNCSRPLSVRERQRCSLTC